MMCPKCKSKNQVAVLTKEETYCKCEDCGYKYNPPDLKDRLAKRVWTAYVHALEIQYGVELEYEIIKDKNIEKEVSL